MRPRVGGVMEQKTDRLNEILYLLARPCVLALSLAFVLIPAVKLSEAFESGADFLRIDTDARAGAMGSAGAAAAFGAAALNYNPAGMAAMNKGEFAFSHTQWLPGSMHDYLGIAMPVRGGSAWKAGLGVTRLSNSGMDGRSDDRSAAGGYSAYDQSAALGIAAAFGYWSAGGAVKYIQSSIAGVGAGAFAFDLGLRRAVPGLPVTVGLSVQNMGRGIKYLSQRDPLPLSAAIGVVFTPLAGFSLALDAKRFMHDKETVFSMGSEYKLFGDSKSVSAMALRGGLGGGRNAEGRGLSRLWSAGAGIRLFDMNMDYALTPYGDLGNSQKITLKKKF